MLLFAFSEFFTSTAKEFNLVHKIIFHSFDNRDYAKGLLALTRNSKLFCLRSRMNLNMMVQNYFTQAVQNEETDLQSDLPCSFDTQLKYSLNFRV